MSNNQIIINNIRRLIRLKGLKQCAVAEKAGFSPNAFSAMLTERKAIMAEYMPDIASALGVPVNTVRLDGRISMKSSMAIYTALFLLGMKPNRCG